MAAIPIKKSSSSEPRGDSGGSGWRKEAVKTAGRIHDITEKNAERDLHVQPTNPDLHEAKWMNTAFSGLSCV